MEFSRIFDLHFARTLQFLNDCIQQETGLAARLPTVKGRHQHFSYVSMTVCAGDAIGAVLIAAVWTRFN
jgi:hypothetical protein